MDKKYIISIFHDIDNLVEVCENPDWFKLANVSKIETLLKCAFSLEKTFEDLSKKGLLLVFKRKLDEWWIYRGAPYEYGVNFFECICDKILLNVMVNTNDSLVAQNAMDWYLKHCGMERLVVIANDILIFGDTYRLLVNLTEGKNVIKHNTRVQLLLSYFVKELNLGRREIVRSHILDLDCHSMLTFLCLLSLPISNTEPNNAQEIVLHAVMGTLNDHDIFLRVVDVEKSLLVSVVKQNPPFMEALTLEVIKVGKLFNHILENCICSWKNVEVDISYEKYVEFFRFLISIDGPAKSKLYSLTLELMSEPNGSFWESIMRDASIFI